MNLHDGTYSLASFEVRASRLNRSVPAITAGVESGVEKNYNFLRTVPSGARGGERLLISRANPSGPGANLVSHASTRLAEGRGGSQHSRAPRMELGASTHRLESKNPLELLGTWRIC
ncbi:Uncharacterized protein DAT39_000077 [Clarias magur]|uniref:Uncharacterized protein n=1 Tax=Clarias magur TaxID=1594786 RepID=A0A8J4XIT4_CLAMG|nr:Uncharacterized protein DAT39_000077 [Clarias magur]